MMGCRRVMMVLAVVMMSGAAMAEDWPQWLGPQRDGVWREGGIIEHFPAEGLHPRWRASVGGGYAGPAVSSGKVFVTDHLLKQGADRPRDPFARITQAGVERVLCFDERTGKPLWTHEYDCPYSISYSAGPRATPAIDVDRVYTLGAEGDLLCLGVSDGHVIWSKHLSGELAPTPTWGFAGHPLVDGKKLIVLSCGTDAAKGQGLVTAFDKMTGDVLWTALAADRATGAGYCPPMIFQACGTRQLIIWDPKTIHSLDPETGKSYWSEPFGPVQNGVSIATPRMYHDPQLGSLLYVTSAPSGSIMLKLDASAPKASVLWKRVGKGGRKTEAVQSLMSWPTLRDGDIYGIDIMGELRCVEIKSGNRIWETFDATTGEAGPQMWATAFLFPIGDAGTRYLIVNEHGDLILADLSHKGFSATSRTHLLDPTNSDPGRPVLWCCPALADRCIFWRNDKEIVCASLAADRTQ
jgi:outer membrane protein assembly factor BamB